MEDTYQKKTPVEHVLLRPDTYIGSTEVHSTQAWVLDEGEKGMRVVGERRKLSALAALPGRRIVKSDVSYVPGLAQVGVLWDLGAVTVTLALRRAVCVTV